MCAPTIKVAEHGFSQSKYLNIWDSVGMHLVEAVSPGLSQASCGLWLSYAQMVAQNLLGLMI